MSIEEVIYNQFCKAKQKKIWIEDIHNKSLEQLREKFPQFVKLREKVAKNSGEWSGKTKLAATISWKRAYESSQISNLEEFFS